jgi:hypothetical protein
VHDAVGVGKGIYPSLRRFDEKSAGDQQQRYQVTGMWQAGHIDA